MTQYFFSSPPLEEIEFQAQVLFCWRCLFIIVTIKDSRNVWNLSMMMRWWSDLVKSKIVCSRLLLLMRNASNFPSRLQPILCACISGKLFDVSREWEGRVIEVECRRIGNVMLSLQNSPYTQFWNLVLSLHILPFKHSHTPWKCLSSFFHTIWGWTCRCSTSAAWKESSKKMNEKGERELR